MNNKILITAIFSLVILTILISNVSAFCIIDGYTFIKSSIPESKLTPSNVNAYCQGLNETSNLAPNTYYLVLFGDLSDSCQSACENVYITATNYTLRSYGYPDNGYPLNSSNVINWSNGQRHHENITLTYKIKPSNTLMSSEKPKLNLFNWWG